MGSVVNYGLVALILGWAVWYMVRKIRSVARGKGCCGGERCGGPCSGCPSASRCAMKKRS